MNQPIFKLEVKIADTSEACVVAMLERILNEINQGFYRGEDRYYNGKEDDLVDCGSYEYRISEKFVEQDKLIEEI
ncbi:hypothetical protein [Aquitalea pelogenes]|uniref:hypothetical protein n=1 Tax=Aquitalea pelogenes TaxID=1293573 RepID=UPI0035B39B54